MLCRAACFAVLSLSYHARGYWRYRTTGTTAVRTRYHIFHIVESQKKTLTTQPSYSSAAQRSAVRCRAVRCCALPCGAVPCCAVLSFEHTTAAPDIMRYQVPIGCVRVCPSSFRFLHLIILSRSSFFVENYTNTCPYWRSERDVANRHTAQHRPISSAQVAFLGS